MNFLNPSILFGLFAVLIPVIIHLLNLRKIRKIEFSTLMFIREIQKSKMRRIRLKQILLLILRMLVITFLVLCFSRPVYEGYAGTDGGISKSTTLIFLDDSFSMSAKENASSNFETGKEYVNKILKSHEETDEIYFIPFSFISLKDRNLLYDSFEELEDSVKYLSVKDKTTSFSEIINLSGEILNKSLNPVKEIFVVSDFQNVNFDMNAFTDRSREKILPDNTAVYFLKTGKGNFNNLSIDSFSVLTKLPERNKDIRMKINLNNYSPSDMSNLKINLYINGELISEKAFDVKGYENTEAEFKFNPGNESDIKGYFELVRNNIADDQLIQDNRIYFNLYIPKSFNVTVIEDKPDDAKFIKLALNAAKEILSDSASGNSELLNISYEKLITGKIFESNVVFISGKKMFSESEAEILGNYLSGGGGVFLFSDKEIDIENYNSVLFGKINSVTAGKVLNQNEISQNLKFEKIDFENPLISDIFSNKNLNITNEKFIIESPSINSYYNYLLGPNSRPVIMLSDNSPFLTESVISKGRLLISSVSASDDMSDFPMKSIFVPLIIRSIYYLGNSFENRNDYITGKNNLIEVKNLKNITGMILPDKKQIDFNVDFNNNNDNIFLLPYAGFTESSGHYILKDSSANEFRFSLNYNPVESNTSVLNEEEVKSASQKYGVSNLVFISNINEVETRIKESRTGIGLWKYFLITAIIFLLLEIFLSKKLEES